MATYNPFEKFIRPKTETGVFSETEVNLANRNSGLPLESLEYDVTPIGQHYLLIHFDIPKLNQSDHIISFTGDFLNPFTLNYKDIKKMPSQTIPVTLECAGNGRSSMEPRSFSMPWSYGAVGTSEWTGTPMKALIKSAKPKNDAINFIFTGADRGFDSGLEHNFERSLTVDQINNLDVLLVYEMNGKPLLPQHGAPFRIVVPGWYGMASVKWLSKIKASTEPFQGYQQVGTYRYRQKRDDEGEPITSMKVKSLMKPPGIPDWTSRKRIVTSGKVDLMGRAWSGGGRQIIKVEVSINGSWHNAIVDKNSSKYAWTKWNFEWTAIPGDYIISSRATDKTGDIQPLEALFDVGGFANNSVQKTHVFVRKAEQ